MRSLYTILVVLLSVGISGASDESPTLVTDTSISSPSNATVKPYSEEGWVSLRWILVENATAYQIWREVVVTHAEETSGAVVQLGTPEKAWIPWAQIEHVPGEQMASAIVATLDNVPTRWGISTIIVRDDTQYTSPIQAIEASPTLIQGVRWSDVKSSTTP